MKKEKDPQKDLIKDLVYKSKFNRTSIEYRSERKIQELALQYYVPLV